MIPAFFALIAAVAVLGWFRASLILTVYTRSRAKRMIRLRTLRQNRQYLEERSHWCSP